MSGQIDFAAALLDSELPVPAGLIDPQGRAAGKRFGVYRNNVVSSLIEAMRASFPVIHKLLGDENFTNICGLFVRQHPPQSPVLMFFGSAFPDFLEDFPPLAHLPYLRDVARLELAQRHSYHAADATPLGAEVFEGLDDGGLSRARIDLVPSARIVTSAYPIVGIWRFNMIEGAPKPAPEQECALVYRAEFDPAIEAIDAPTAACLAALQAGATLGEALAAADAIAADYDPSTAIGTLLRCGLMADFKTE